MSKIKFLHCSDLHLDAAFTSLGGYGDKASVRRQDIRETFGEIIRLAQIEDVDFLFISGDLFEHQYVKKSTIRFLHESFMHIPKIKVCITPGNHDPYLSNSYYRNFEWSSNVHIFHPGNPTLYFNDLQTQVYGAGFQNFYEGQSLVENIPKVNPDFFNILLVHGTVDMNFSRQAYNPMNSEYLAGMGMDFIGLGHFHNLLEKISGTHEIYNPGSPEPLGFDEDQEHGIFIGALEKMPNGEKHLEVEFVHTGRKFYRNTDIFLEKAESSDEAIRNIEREIYNACISHKNPAAGLFNITLKGYTAVDFHFNLQQLQAYFQDKVFFLRISDETSVAYDLDELMKEPGLRGLFARKVFFLMDGEKDESRKKLLMKSLYFGLEALERGKVEIE